MGVLIGTLAVDGWAVIFGTARRGLGWLGPFLPVPNVTAHPSTATVPTSYYSMWHCNCLWSLDSKGLSRRWQMRGRCAMVMSFRLFVCLSVSCDVRYVAAPDSESSLSYRGDTLVTLNTGWHIKKCTVNCLQHVYHTYAENFYNISTVLKTLGNQVSVCLPFGAITEARRF